MELTTDLPWTHFKPASRTDHFDESIIIGTRLISGSAAIKFRNRTMDASESSIASSMLTSIDLGAVFDLLPGDTQRRLVVAGQDQLLEFRRAGDVRALAHHDEALGGIQGRGVSGALVNISDIDC